MYHLASNINYLSLDGLPWILLCWILMIITRPLSTFIHEFGHLVPIYLFSSEPITFQIGDGKSYPFKIGSRVEFDYRGKDLQLVSFMLMLKNYLKGNSFLY